ncbi:hypothetical protein D3874_08845 [Oleomonas cavernae]|uniref:Oxidoreductase molybdopterin-binding domain-containing protein n=1 Tax=Oleomonas cavernae TaxID=2320859 RepID=A0A418WAS8_9PROT|nr:hypothetical protein [Oleomonas cavernae]RJF87120.1 hypothetical protein D3874_08845 [Oleomonas cavernae]
MQDTTRRHLMAIAAGALLAARAGRGLAAEQALLTVANAAGAATAFDRAALEALPQATIATMTPFTEGMSDFGGPTMQAVLEAANATAGTQLRLTALNDYTVDVPMSDLAAYGPILAMRQDGKLLSVRNKGPLWLIYPLSQRPELNVPKVHDRLIWQVKTVAVT